MSSLLLLPILAGVWLPGLECVPAPIRIPFGQTTGQDPQPADSCYLPDDFGNSGKRTFIEDCPNLDRFTSLPKPGHPQVVYGIHSMVCCPKPWHKSSICFSTDYWCPSYKHESTSPSPGPSLEGITMGSRQCGGDVEVNGTLVTYSCTRVSQCSANLDADNGPALVALCGFDEDASEMMVCCASSDIQETGIEPQAPRFPLNEPETPRQCEDRTEFCAKWKDNDGCKLDKNFVISKGDKFNGYVSSLEMVTFMMVTCTQTCGWCGNKGCVDELPRCPQWAKIGWCNARGAIRLFMVHACRESCGLCGFLSPYNTEIQETADRTYTAVEDEKFSCGKYKPLTEIEGYTPPATTTTASTTTSTTTTTTTTTTEPGTAHPLFGGVDLRAVDNSTAEEDDIQIIFYSSDEDANIKCGATPVNDRWLVGAAHCFDNFEKSYDVRLSTVRSNTIFKEAIDIKRVYIHPSYDSIVAHNDLAVIELGRRIEYDYDRIGDMPMCLDQGFDLIGKPATVQGFGKTETESHGDLLEGNFTIISPEMCHKEFEKTTVASQSLIEAKIPYGFDFGLFCALDFSPENRTIDGKVVLLYSNSCKGDSGGPTFIQEEDKRYLVGVVSGGPLSCLDPLPSWYVRVSHHYQWIRCVIDQSSGGSRDKVETECLEKAAPAYPKDDRS